MKKSIEMFLVFIKQEFLSINSLHINFILYYQGGMYTCGLTFASTVNPIKSFFTDAFVRTLSIFATLWRILTFKGPLQALVYI